ncbi:MAG: AbrB/MazE/SpoVT family DNA-binding domain-containing protein [Actinobacteria bacterium]|nr:AbrB/MazE/SpoVT family DNA-binding domain-containing protein [Actinomycetota bacterium]
MNRGEAIKVGKRGTVVIPASLRKAYHLDEGSLLVVEPREEGIMLRPAIAYPIEIYTPERKAEFFLNNAVTKEDYAWALKQVEDMGLDPQQIPHKKPGK